MGLLELFKEKISASAYYPIGSDDGVIIYFPKQQETCNSETELLGINLALEYSMEHFEVDKAQIICFGNNLYGKEVMNIWRKYPNVKIELMVCSPDAEIIKDGDRRVLKQKIKMAKDNSKTTIYESDLPPTLRSCILYNGTEPILCCVQYYVLSVGEHRKPSFTGRGTPCVIAYHNETEFPLKQYVEFCETEFLRLKENVYHC